MNNKRRMRTGKKAMHNRKVVMLSGVAAVSAIALVIGMLIYLFISGKKVDEIASNNMEQSAIFEAALQEEETKNAAYISADTIDSIVAAGKGVSEALSKRPETVEMTAENTAELANIVCSIEGSSKVKITVESDGIPKSDDKYYYLFEQATYDEEISDESEPVARVYSSSTWYQNPVLYL